MAYDKNSNFATFAFAISMVLIFGTILTVVKLSLKDKQEANEKVKKMMDILGAIQVDSERSTAEAIFSDYVEESYIINYDGDKVDGKGEAFDVDIQKDHKDRSLTAENKLYPLYKCNKNDTTLYVVPMVGTGLWGPIWGFVAIEDDFKTIYGVSFNHKKETPGLGAEIKSQPFLSNFNGKDKKVLNLEPSAKKLFDVLKGGSGASLPYQVDGITGGTITSKALEEMMNRTFRIYLKHFDKIGQ